MIPGLLAPLNYPINVPEYKNVPAFIGFVLVADKMEKLSLDFTFFGIS